MDMQSIQKFTDFQSKKAEATQAIKEADLQKEYGEVFVSLLKKYGVSSPAELDDDKKKEFFNEIGDYYKKGEGQTAKGEELVDKEGGDAPVKEEEGEAEEEKEEEKIIDDIASNEKKEVAEDAAEDIEKEKVEMGEPEKAEGDVEKQPEEVKPAADTKDDPEAGKAAEPAADEDTAKDIEKEKVDAGKPEKVVMDFDAFVKANFDPKA